MIQKLNTEEYLRATGEEAASAAGAADAGGGAGGYGGGYDFGTLWQEITNGIGHIVQSITNGMQVRGKTDQIITYAELEKHNIRYGLMNNVLNKTKSSSTGFTLIVVLVLGGLLAAAIYISKQQKNRTK